MQPKYRLKVRKFYSDLICEKIYPSVVAKMKDKVAKTEKLSFTTDIWSHPSAGVSLLSLTAYEIDSDWKRFSAVLAASELTKKHTGEKFQPNSFKCSKIGVSRKIEPMW